MLFNPIGSALKPGGRAQLRLVPKGERKSLEDVLEETRTSPRWAGYFREFHDPYLHLTPEQYARLAERTARPSYSHSGENLGFQIPRCIFRLWRGNLRRVDAFAP